MAFHKYICAIFRVECNMCMYTRFIGTALQSLVGTDLFLLTCVCRSGRTGRAGKTGTTIAMVTVREMGYFKRILKQIEVSIEFWPCLCCKGHTDFCVVSVVCC